MWKTSIVEPMKYAKINEGFLPLKTTSLNSAATNPDRQVEIEQAILV
jgi:hypothetical protein